MTNRKVIQGSLEWPKKMGPASIFRTSSPTLWTQMPKTLWTRGETSLKLLDRPTLGIVGARGCSSYGRAVAREFGRLAAEAGYIVISGLARGIDAEAHRGAIGTVGGQTVAVLGCGIDHTYPAANAEIAHAIIEDGGLILSEYEPGVAPAPWRFPARNRIIAALSDVVVCVEARERSGSLITCDFALEFGRPVMAVPGEITSEISRGSNGLLRVPDVRPALAFEDVITQMEEVLNANATV